MTRIGTAKIVRDIVDKQEYHDGHSFRKFTRDSNKVLSDLLKLLKRQKIKHRVVTTKTHHVVKWVHNGS